MELQLLIPPDSPLRNPPSTLEPVQKLAFDGARFGFDMTHIAYQRLYGSLERLGTSMRGGERGGADFTLAFVDAWAVVDNLWRLHQLTRRFPGLKKSPHLEVHLRAIAQVEELRHGFQHAAEKLKRMARDEHPVVGTLTWFWTPGRAAAGRSRHDDHRRCHRTRDDAARQPGRKAIHQTHWSCNDGSVQKASRSIGTVVTRSGGCTKDSIKAPGPYWVTSRAVVLMSSPQLILNST